MTNEFDKWKKHSVMYWWIIVLLVVVFVVSLILRLTEFSTGIAVMIVLVGSGIAILVMSLLIIRYLLNKVRPGGKQNKWKKK